MRNISYTLRNALRRKASTNYSVMRTPLPIQSPKPSSPTQPTSYRPYTTTHRISNLLLPIVQIHSSSFGSGIINMLFWSRVIKGAIRLRRLRRFLLLIPRRRFRLGMLVVETFDFLLGTFASSHVHEASESAAGEVVELVADGLAFGCGFVCRFCDEGRKRSVANFLERSIEFNAAILQALKGCIEHYDHLGAVWKDSTYRRLPT
jgi:hypothetical protein